MSSEAFEQREAGEKRDPYGIVPPEFLERFPEAESIREALEMAEREPSTTPVGERERCPINGCGDTRIRMKLDSVARQPNRVEGDRKCGNGHSFSEALPPLIAISIDPRDVDDPTAPTGEELQTLRKALDLHRPDVADRCDLETYQIKRVENGQSTESPKAARESLLDVYRAEWIDRYGDNPGPEWIEKYDNFEGRDELDDTSSEPTRHQLREMRNTLDLSQRDVAERCDWSPKSISRLERGEEMASFDAVRKAVMAVYRAEWIDRNGEQDGPEWIHNYGEGDEDTKTSKPVGDPGEIPSIRPDEINLPTPDELLQLRDAAGLSAREVASRADMAHTTLARYEGGDRSPRLSTVKTLLDVYSEELADQVNDSDDGSADRADTDARLLEQIDAVLDEMESVSWRAVPSMSAETAAVFASILVDARVAMEGGEPND